MKDLSATSLHKKKNKKNVAVIDSRVSSCYSKKSDEKRLSKQIIRLIDANGVDLTPLPLLSDDKKIKDEKDQSTDLPQGSYQSNSSMHITNPFAFTRSYISGVSPTDESQSETSDTVLNRGKTYKEIKTLVQPKEDTILTKTDLDKLVEIKICETETYWLFDQAPKWIACDAEETPTQLKQNEIYKELIASRIGNDRYIKQGMNTFNNSVISKTVQTVSIGLNDKSVTATNWDIDDTFNAIKENQNSKLEKTETKSGNLVEQVFEINKDQLLNDANSTTVLDNNISEQSLTQVETSYIGSNILELFLNDNLKTMDVSFLCSPKFLRDLYRMERALNLNTYYEKLIKYQSIMLKQFINLTTANLNEVEVSSVASMSTTKRPTIEENAVSMSAKDSQHRMSLRHSVTTNASQSSIYRTSENINQSSMTNVQRDFKRLNVTLLWQFECSLTRNRNISDMAWNKENPYILAVGYGQFEFDNQQTGLVCCWSLKCIEYPERFYETPNSVTALAWSQKHSNLLAVGMFNGVIYVYDVHKTEQTPVIDTTNSEGRHFGVVRKLQWVTKGSELVGDLSEDLISVSSDGRVIEWYVRKGFESSGDSDYHRDLMILKRVNVKNPGCVTKAKRADALISRTAFGTCMAFNLKDPTIYVVGTEDGLIHKCSRSYNEQYLDTFVGHNAAVYQLEWSPFMAEMFLSCSADWSIKIWHVDYTDPLINIQTSLNVISSISWSPYNSVMFASANESSLCVWDLNHSIVDPISTELVSNDSNMSQVLFSENSNSILIGNDQGAVFVYNLDNLFDVKLTENEQHAQLEQLMQTSLTNQS